MMKAHKSTKSKWIIISIVVLVVALGAVIYWNKSGSSTNGLSYSSLRVEYGDLVISILSTGGVEPENRLQIKPPVAGRIEEILVKEGQRVEKGQILAWMSSTERAALIDAALSKGEEEVKKWKELYRPTPIMAPISGTIILKSVETGQTFTNSDPVFVMSDRLTVKAQVDETDIGKIKLGQKAQIALDAYSDKILEARVNHIAFDATTTNNVTTYVVDVLPKKTPDFMRSGMTANVVFILAEKNHVLLLPSSAIFEEEGKKYVLREGQDKKQTLRVFVETGLTDGKNTEILSGLNEGDIILSQETDFLIGSESKKSSNPFMPNRPRLNRNKKN